MDGLCRIDEHSWAKPGWTTELFVSFHTTFTL